MSSRMKRTVYGLVIALLVLAFQPVIVNGNTDYVVAPTSSTQSEEGSAPISSTQSEEGIAPASLVAVGVFIAGILVGWMADGLLMYTTGYSGAELSKKAIAKIDTNIRNHIGIKNVYYIPSTGYVGSGFGGGGGGAW